MCVCAYKYLFSSSTVIEEATVVVLVVHHRHKWPLDSLLSNTFNRYLTEVTLFVYSVFAKPAVRPQSDYVNINRLSMLAPDILGSSFNVKRRPVLKKLLQIFLAQLAVVSCIFLSTGAFKDS